MHARAKVFLCAFASRVAEGARSTEGGAPARRPDASATASAGPTLLWHNCCRRADLSFIARGGSAQHNERRGMCSQSVKRERRARARARDERGSARGRAGKSTPMRKNHTIVTVGGYTHHRAALSEARTPRAAHSVSLEDESTNVRSCVLRGAFARVGTTSRADLAQRPVRFILGLALSAHNKTFPFFLFC